MSEINSVITFKLSDKKKRGLLLATIFSAIFGAGAIWLSRILSIGSGRFILLLSGIFLIFITGFCMYAYYLLAKENFAAVYVSDEGVIDISTGNHIGTVLWKDVENIKIMDDLSNLKHKYIVIKVRNPKEYIDREPNHSKKRTLELKLQYYGSPICFLTGHWTVPLKSLKMPSFQGLIPTGKIIRLPPK